MRRSFAVLVVAGVAVLAHGEGELPAWTSDCQAELRPQGSGNVLGAAEQTVADWIQAARCAENRAIAALGTGPGPSEGQREDAGMWLSRGIEALMGASDCLATADSGGRLQRTTSRDTVDARIDRAISNDQKGNGRIEGGKPRAKIVRSIEAANREKTTALLALQGIVADPREDEQAYLVPGAPQQYATTAYTNEGAADRDLERRRGARYDGSGGLRPRPRRPDTAPRPPSPEKAAPRNHVLAFQAPPGAQSAFGFFNLDRELRGPFRYRFTAGNFERAPRDDVYLDSNSFVGVEVDVVGSSPLEFFSIGTRYVVTTGPVRGVQVFANSRGQSHGSRFLEGVQAVEVRVDFADGTFRASVKPRGAADDQYVEFAVYARGDASETWVAGMGGASFSGKRVLGIDDLFLEPLPASD